MAPLFEPDTVFSVSQLTFLMRQMLEASFPLITLEGEISNYRPNTSGHLYFTLKDEGAQISAVMFKSNAYRLSFKPKDGMKVRCKGSISIYAPRGNYQIIITSMEAAGDGEILQMLEERKKRFSQEGLFSQENKKPLPRFPSIVGVVTSATGAALRDILQIIRRRNRAISVIVLPSLVQGDGAGQTIAQQIVCANTFNLCDVLIVGRGGGSLEDLLPFSDECVVRAIANSKIPVISAVGHEIDWALSDYAADMRAPTPSAAAELVSPLLSDVSSQINLYQNEMGTALQSRVEKLRLMIKQFDTSNMEVRFRMIEQPLLHRFEDAQKELHANITEKLRSIRETIQHCVEGLEGASPQAILERGYAMVTVKETGKIVRSGADTKEGQILEITPARGRIFARVESTDK